MVKDGDLSVWWIPQVPGKAFRVPVATLHAAALIMDTLAAYDNFQFKNRIKPDYCNAGGLSIFEDGAWVDWYDEDGFDFDEWRENNNVGSFVEYNQ
jgi:hypothetical protein